MARTKPKSRKPHQPRRAGIKEMKGLYLVWRDSDPLSLSADSMFDVRAGHKNPGISGRSQNIFRAFGPRIIGGKGAEPMPMYWRIEVSVQFATTECVDWEYQPEDKATIDDINNALVPDIDEVLTLRLEDAHDFEYVQFRAECLG